MAEQQQGFSEALDEEKWYLSERAGCDVGFEVAINSFLENHVDRFAHDFRLTFCRQNCPERENCRLAEGAEKMPDTKTIVRHHGTRLGLNICKR
jgi:hypothetical protein